MPEETSQDYTPLLLGEFNAQLRDIEEKQRLLKDRVLLIGQNLIEAREDLEEKVTELKLAVEEIKTEQEKIKREILMILEKLDKKANKNEVEILRKQAKIFSALEFVRLEDLKKFLEK